MMLLLRMAVDKFGADWVASIDADEFIETADWSGADAGSGWAAADSLQAGMEQLRLRFGLGAERRAKSGLCDKDSVFHLAPR